MTVGRALLPVSVNLSGIDMRASQSAISSTESVLVPPEWQFGGGFVIDEQPDYGTDLEDELPSPDGSPMVISHGVSRFPARLEGDVDLAQILAQFVTLPAIMTPIHDPQEMRVMTPAECRPPEALADVFVPPADNNGRPPIGGLSSGSDAGEELDVPRPGVDWSAIWGSDGGLSNSDSSTAVLSGNSVRTRGRIGYTSGASARP